MPASRVVWIGETKTPLLASISRKYTTTCVRSGKQALDALHEHATACVVLDGASLNTTGDRIILALRRDFPQVRVLLIWRDNDADTHADTVVVPTISSRVLLREMENLIINDTTDCVVCGVFRLDSARGILHTPTLRIRLNPKQCKLLTLFFTHPNAVIKRSTLMHDVWETDYMGDTRTLDVHIRWVRTALADPTPQSLTISTIRGVGYRLDVP